MAKIQIKSETRHELSFFPNSFDDYVPKDSKVRMVDRIVRSMDINPLMDTYDGIGAPPYSPKMLLSLVVFAYINGVYSCRGIADALKYDVRYMWICGGKRLSFATINRFRTNHMIKCIDFYFDAVVSILAEKGVISLEEQYVDGTKIESKANKYTFVWKKTVEKNRAKLLEKTSAALDQIKEQIRLNGGSDIREEDSEPVTSAKDVERSARLCERQVKNLPKAKLTGREKQKLNTQIDHLFKASDKLREYEKSLDILGERNSYSKTDPDATFMRLKEDAMNNGQMEEMVGYVKYNWFHKEQHKPFKEDVFNQANFYYNKDEDYYVCPMGQHMNPCGQRQTKSDSGYVSVITLYRAQRCEGCPLGSLCKKAKGNRTIYVNHKLNAYKKEAFLLLTSEEGMKHRSQRPIEPEAAFGQMKEDMHYKRFRHFGKDKVYMDIGLFGIGFNLKKHLGIKR